MKVLLIHRPYARLVLVARCGSCAMPPADASPVDLARASYEHTSPSDLPKDAP